MNAAEIFGRDNFYIIADNCSEALIDFIRSEGFEFEETHLGNSPSFKYMLAKIVNDAKYNDDDIIYLLEDDYLHLPGSKELIFEGLEIADYVTLYDHSDQYLKYKFRRGGAAPLNRFSFHRWKIFLTQHSHWRETPSTTMTFAAKMGTLREDFNLWKKQPDSGIPRDFVTFLRVTKQTSFIDAMKISRKAGLFVILNNFAFFRKKRLLISSIPGRSTHCEKKFLSPLTDWTKI